MADPNQFCGALPPFDGNADCSAMCDAYCANLGGNYAQHTSGCEGFCNGGPNDGFPCGESPDCPDGACVGLASGVVLHPFACQCQCVQLAGAPSPAGTISCFLSARIVLESSAPCDGLDIASVQGVPLTTDATSGVILDPLLQLGTQVGPLLRQGTPISCSALEADNLTGMTIFGIFASLDSTLGDFATPFKFVCE